LSAAANEFVPSTLDAGSAGPRSGPRNTSQWAVELQTDQQQPEQHNPQLEQQQPEPSDPLSEMRANVQAVIYSPGQFDAVAAHLADVLNAGVTDLDTMRSCVDVVLTACLDHSNFRYAGARLSERLATSVQVSVTSAAKEEEDASAGEAKADADAKNEAEGGKTFSQVLTERCEKLHDTRHELIKEDPARYRGLALLAADLFLQSVGCSDERRAERMNEIACSLLRPLAGKVGAEAAAGRVPDKEDVRSVVMALKIAGKALEEDEKARKGGATPDLDALMTDLQAASDAASEELKAHVMPLSALLDLRATGWGKTGNSQPRPPRPQPVVKAAPAPAPIVAPPPPPETVIDRLVNESY